MRRIHWEFPSADPVLRPGQVNGEWDSKVTACGHVVLVDDRYRFYYWGRGDDDVNRICIAESPVDRPNDWTGLGAVLGPQEDTDYNCGGAVSKYKVIAAKIFEGCIEHCGCNVCEVLLCRAVCVIIHPHPQVWVSI